MSTIDAFGGAPVVQRGDVLRDVLRSGFAAPPKYDVDRDLSALRNCLGR